MNKHIRVNKHKRLLSSGSGERKRQATGDSPIKTEDAEQQCRSHAIIREEFQMNAKSRGYTWMIQTFVSKFKHITKSQTPSVRNAVNVFTTYTCICFHIYVFYAISFFLDTANNQTKIYITGQIACW